jgi:hypothetical protein
VADKFEFAEDAVSDVGDEGDVKIHLHSLEKIKLF